MPIKFIQREKNFMNKKFFYTIKKKTKKLIKFLKLSESSKIIVFIFIF